MVQQKKISTQLDYMFVECNVNLFIDPALPMLCELKNFGSVFHLGLSLHTGTHVL